MTAVGRFMPFCCRQLRSNLVHFVERVLMRLPEFLVIGAMKSGTTTLFNDLLSQPSIFLAEKEQNFFCSDEALNRDALHRYAGAFEAAGSSQLCGDVSTTYSMIPDIDGVAQRARQILSADTRIVYIVREPVSRALSHHYHMLNWHGSGKMGSDVDDCVRQHGSIVNYGRYFMQLTPWVEHFGMEAIHVIIFEEYIRDRQSTVASLCRFLGVSAAAERVNADKVYNRGEGKPVLNGFWEPVYSSAVYRKLIRPWIASSAKERLMRWLLPKATPRPAPPNIATVDYLIEHLRDDAERLRMLLGRKEPIWDFEAIRRRHATADVPSGAVTM